MASLNPDKVRNIRVIILSVIAAATFWFLNALNGTYTTTIRYPIEFIYDTDRYISLGSLPKSVLINVSGLGWDLFRGSFGLKTTPVQFVLDNPSETKKLTSASILGTVSNQLKEFNINFVLSDTLLIDMDEKGSGFYQLKADSAAISLEKNFRIVSPIRLSPNSVALQGPLSLLKALGDTIRVKIPDEDINEDFAEDIPVEVPGLNLIVRDPPTVSISFEVEEYREVTAQWPIRPLHFPEDSSAYLSLSEVAVRYEVNLSDAEKVDDGTLSVLADFDLWHPADSTIALQLVRHDAFVRHVIPETTTVKVLFNDKKAY